jgi:hypothetical protein
MLEHASERASVQSQVIIKSLEKQAEELAELQMLLLLRQD